MRQAHSGPGAKGELRLLGAGLATVINYIRQLTGEIHRKVQALVNVAIAEGPFTRK